MELIWPEIEQIWAIKSTYITILVMKLIKSNSITSSSLVHLPSRITMSLTETQDRVKDRTIISKVWGYQCLQMSAVAGHLV